MTDAKEMPVRLTQTLSSALRLPHSHRGSAGAKPIIALVVALTFAGAAVWGWKLMWKSAGEQRVSKEATPSPNASGQTSPAEQVPRVADQGKIDEVLQAAASRAQVSDWAGAEVILREAARTYPGVPRIHQTFAECLLQAGKRPDALEQYEKAIAAGEPDADLLTIAGTVASSVGKPQRAIELYRQATVKSPEKGEAFLLLGQVQMKHATLDEAKASLLQAGRLITDRGVIWGTLAEIGLRENKLQLAEQYIVKARQIEPNMLDWRLIEARLRNRLNQPEKSVAILGGLSETELLQRRTARLLSESMSMMGEKREAMELLCRASEANLSDAELAMDAAAASERAGDTVRAIKMAERATNATDEKVKSAANTLLTRLRNSK